MEKSLKVLMLVNWKIKYCDTAPRDKQPPDYFIEGGQYWFYKYFSKGVSVEVADIHTFPWLEHFEKEKLRFYLIQTLRILPKLNKYDLIVSHGMQSGIVLSLFRKFFKTKAKHIVFDIGSFNSAAEGGGALKLMQLASKSIDGIIYHTEKQLEYYKKFFPWVTDTASYIQFGTDADFFNPYLIDKNTSLKISEGKYILCVGYNKRDWNTLYAAYKNLKNIKVKLRLIGKEDFCVKDTDVQAVSFLPVRELMEEIKNALFCVVPLEYFNYSYGQMTLLQQMALGKAVIAARVPSMEGYVKDGETALFYEPGDSKQLSVQMQRLLNDSELRVRIENNAYKYIHEIYNERDMAVLIEEFYVKVWKG